MFEDKDTIVVIGSVVAFIAAIVIVIDVVALGNATITFIRAVA